ncbi:MAG: FAD-dependent oxidoreductase [Kiritimatiellae bacterium]|nr:FAD-dependent oxidoreductase [Kiritimatiellia bacterium]
MKTYQEKAREIPVVAEVDVLVVGGGPAGVGAALAAARSGANTLVIEQTNCLGGMATSGMMSHWSGSTSSPVGKEIFDRMRSNTSLPVGWKEDKPECISHEAQKRALLDLVEEAGAKIQFHTWFAGAIVEDGRVVGVITESKSGREAIMAKVTIDATGDGDVAASAGAEFILGREGDNVCQPVTLMFRIGGVDYSRAIFPPSFESYVNVPKGEVQALGKSHLPFPAGHVLLYPARLPGEVCVNMTNVIDIDGTNVRDLTKAEVVCRRQMDAIVAFLREFVPGYENCYTVASASNVGVRETRHVKGVYTLTAEDIVEANVFDDWIAVRNYFNFDIHNTKGNGLDANGAQAHFHAKGEYTIPYRCIVPEKIDGLLLSGRNISGTHKAHSNFRVMTICLNIGYGAGVAAALAAKAGIQPRDVDPKAIQTALRAVGFEP